MGINRVEFTEDFPYGFHNTKAVGKLPMILPSPLKLNLGCGRDVRDGYINIDIYSDDDRVIGMDVRQLKFRDNSVDFINASHILELISHREIDGVLREWARVLKPDGEILIKCPNLKLQLTAYNRGDWDIDVLAYMLFGGQTNQADYICSAFDFESLSYKLRKAGLEIIDSEEQDFPQDKGFMNLTMAVRAIKIGKNEPFSNTDSFESKNNINDKNNLTFIFDKKTDQENDSAEIVNDIIQEEEEEPDEYLFLLEENVEKENYLEKDENIMESEFEFDFTKEGSDIVDFGDNFDISLLSEIVNGIDFGQMVDVVLQQSKKNNIQLNIVWEGSQFVYHSLALINREHCYNIIKSDVANLTIIPYEPDQFDYNSDMKYKLLLGNDIRFKTEVSAEISKLPYIWIRHQWPPKSEAPKGSKWIIMQPWEFTSLRRDFVDIFNQANEIWTPSNFSRNAFVNSGVDFNKVQVIPNGINPDLFKPFGPKYNLKTKKKLKLLYVGGTIYRKGIDILLSAFIKVFTIADNVCLVIKDMGGNTFYNGQTAQDIISNIKKNNEAPEIEYIDNDLSENEIASLYRACNILVSPYRGEGFSLPTLEAMACGLPVIVTEGGSTEDFTDETFAWKIPAIKQSIGNIIDGYPLADEAFLLEPDSNILIDVLKDIYQDTSNLKSMGMLASYSARTDWTWQKATLKLLTRLDYLYGTNMSEQAQNQFENFEDSSLILASAELSFAEGDFEDSKEKFEKALTSGDLTDEYRIHAIHRLILMAINRNDELAVESLLNEAERVCPGHADTIYVRTIYLASKNKNDEALEELTKLIDNWQELRLQTTFGLKLDDLLVLMGDLFYGLSELESANKLYTAALKVNNYNAYACYGAGLCFRDSGESELAEQMFGWAVNYDPEFELAKNELEKLKL
jgi:glycosyltransferase involved in cell wall biosynthesis/SAM-dependent methyltransferase